MNKKKVSIVGSCYNEADNIEKLINRIIKVMEPLDYEFEIIIADNASTDGTDSILREIANKEKRLKVIINNRNYGPRLSPRNAAKHCSGDAIISIATDLQDPPELIPEYLKKWEQGFCVVLGKKTSSEEGRIKYSLRHLYYRIIQQFSSKRILEHVSGASLLDKRVMDELMELDPHNSAQFILPSMGYDIDFVEYRQKKREGGKSTYNLYSYFYYAIDSLMFTADAPLRVFLIFGIITSIISFVVGLIYLVLKIRYWYTFKAGIAPLVIGMFALGGIQISMLGLIGEYVTTILRRITKQLPVIEKELINFEDKSE